MEEQLWDLFQPRRLFSPHGEDDRYSEHHNMAQMISLMGPPPLDSIQKSERWRFYWDDEGTMA